MAQTKVLALAAPEHLERLEHILNIESINRMASLYPQPGNEEKALAIPADAIVMLSPVPGDRELEFLENLYMNRSKVVLILLCEHSDTALLTRAMRSGVSRVLTLDMSPRVLAEEITGEVNRMSRRQDTAKVQNYDSRVVAVCSTKGGSGKTSMAVNLAAALQQTGKKTVILDLDLQFGDVGVFLNIGKCDSISELVGESSLTAATVKSYLYHHSSGLDVLCAPPAPELAETIRPEHIEKITTVLRAEYDYVIYDLAPVLDDSALMALDQADCIYFVTNPEIHTLKNTRICLNLMNTLDYTRKVRLVLNRDGDSTVTCQDVERALEMKVFVAIPNDPRTCTTAINRGLPVVLSAPNSKMGKAIRKFAVHEAGAVPEGSGEKKLRKLFGRN